MKLDLEQKEVEFLVAVLGELPTKSGAFPIAVKIQQQVQTQLPPAPAAEEAANV